MVTLIRQRPFAAFAALITLIAVALSEPWASPADSTLQGIQQRGTLIAAIPENPSSYYVGPWGETGFDYEFARNFAGQIGVQLVAIPVKNADEALAMVHKGDADVAIGVAMTGGHAQSFGFSVPVQSLSQHVVCDAHLRNPPAKPGQLVGRPLVVAAGSHHVEQLSALQVELPDLQWDAVDGATTEDLLVRVQDGEADCTLVGADDWQFQRHLFPNLAVAFDLPDALYFGWAFDGNAEGSLRTAASDYIAQHLADGYVEALHDRHFAHLQTLTQSDARHFRQAIRYRLPRYAGAFRAAAQRNDVDWRLLAAVSYQESLWNPEAQSPTGVQGLMQLTLETALQLGIDDRTDPLASIKGGARYLRQIIDQLPADIPDPDRTWMALAAYNAGLAHVLDARELTRARGGDPNDWADVQADLALLKQPAWYSKTRYGYARGATQAIVYVRQVRRYYDLLVLASNSSAHESLMLAASQPASLPAPL